MTLQPVALYVRLSKDDGGESTALARQEKECREFAEREGLSIVKVYSDNESAFSGKQRPAFNEMLADIKQGKYVGVIAWRLDRLTRSGRALADLSETVDAAGAWYRTSADGIDSRMAGAGVMAAITAAVANAESKSSSIRQKAKKRELKEQGRYLGGGTRAYGHVQNRSEIIEAEAAIVREVATRVLSGESLHGVQLDLNARGIATATGARWSVSTVKGLLRSYRLCGGVEHEGNVIITGAIAPILDLDTVERLRSILPAKGTGKRNGQRYILSGLCSCGKCGKGLFSGSSGGSGRRLTCLANKGGCAGVSIAAEPLEDHVTKLLVAALNSADFSEALQGNAVAERAALISQVESDRATIERLTADHYVHGLIDRQTFATALKPLQVRVESAEAELARNTPTSVLDDLMGTTLEAFEALPVSQRQALLKAVILNIEVKPLARRGGNKLCVAERITVQWAA
jgi:site-specific DNA recombinase